MSNEMVFVLLNCLVVFCGIIAIISIQKSRKEMLKINQWATRALERLEAVSKLNKAYILADEGKYFEAFDAVGLTEEMIEDLTLEEARQVFAVRVADLWKTAKGTK